MKSEKIRAVFLIGVAMLLAACSGGGSSSGGGGSTPAPASVSPKFVDSPVDGLRYTTTSNSAGSFTSGGGFYSCQSGETVKFFIGSLQIGNNQTCDPNNLVVTAVSVLGATSVTAPEVVNLSQLLMTLATNVTASAITLPQTLPTGFNSTLVPQNSGVINFTAANFDTAVQSALPAGTTLVTEPAATTQLQTSLKSLSVTIVNGGTVTSSPSGINCTAGTGACSYIFPVNSGVTLTATGVGFTGWSGGTGSASCTGTGTCSITLTADSSVTATFPAAPTPSNLAITNVGAGTVTCSTDAGVTFNPCATSYATPTALVLKATPNSGSIFTGWSNGTGSISCTGTGNCSVTLNADSSVTANFAVQTATFTLTTPMSSASGNGGGGTSITCSTAGSGGPFSPCASSYNAGTNLWLQANPNSVSNFTSWSNGSGSGQGSPSACNGTTGICNFSMNDNSSVTAIFNRPTLTVNVSGTGTVTSNQASLNNCTASCSAPFDKNASITLNTSSAGFTGWNGAGCSGTGSCSVALSVDTTVTANFSQVTTSGRWLFYTDYNFPNATLRYVDPANPGATTTTITTTAAGMNFQQTASWDAVNTAYTNITNQNVAYFSGGKIFTVSTLKSSGAPGSTSNLPVQISSETTANIICHVDAVGATSLSSVKLMYLLPGSGGCANRATGIMKIVGILDSAATTPVTIGTGVDWDLNNVGPEWVTNLSTGAATHVFLTDFANSNTLKLLNLSTNAITTIQANAGPISSVAQDTSDRVFLYGGPGGNILYLYTISTNTLTTLITGASALLPGNPVGDGANLYFAEQASGKLYKVPMTATTLSNVVTLLANAPFLLGDPCGGDTVVTTTNNVFLHTYVPGATPGCSPTGFASDASGLYRVAKTGGAATTIEAHATGTSILNVQSSGNLLYYGVGHNISANNGVPQAKIINENGTSVFSTPGSCFPCGGWAAAISSPSFFVRTGETPLSKVILGSLATGNWNGATLTAFDAPTATQGAVLGVLPTALNPTLASVYGNDFIDTSMLLIGPQNGSPNNYMFFVDSVLPNSLTQVPTGTSAPWQPAQ